MTPCFNLETFRKRKILVVGDLMLDRYLWGDVERISPEAPVPIFHVRKQTEIPGGAGNVVSNLIGLGASVIVIGICGEDLQGQHLRRLLSGDKLHSHILACSDRPTITKTRLVSQGQQMLRLDEEEIASCNESLQNELIDLVKANLPGCHAVILSDYGKGLLQARELVQAIIALAEEGKIPLVIDPKGKSWERYKGATCVTPNTKELETIYGERIVNDAQLAKMMRETCIKFDFSWLVVTRGHLGMCLMDRNGEATFIPTLARQVFDVSGAGDTVTATLALCLGSGIEFSIGAKLANLAAGIVVGKVGTQPIDLHELKASLETTGLDGPISPVMGKVAASDSAINRVEAWKSGRQRIVFTNGCFDLLHPGHIHLLHEARSLGDRLVVAINSDASVRRLKGPKRPILGERDRASLLASLDCVDLVIIFNEDTPERWLTTLRPHVLVKGSDHKEGEVFGQAFVESYGGQVKLIPLLNGYSTAMISGRLTGFQRI